MSLSAANISVATADRKAVVRVVGRANLTASCDFRTLMQAMVEREFSRIAIDLSECRQMDSTFVGVLAAAGMEFSNRCAANGARQLDLLNPTATVTELVASLGIGHLFNILAQAPAAPVDAPALPAPQVEHSREEITQTSLEAHKFLMGINAANEARFKDVARFLAEDLQRLAKCENLPPQKS